MIVYVVCTGPSLKGFDFNKIKSRDCIAVNYAYKYVPSCVFVCALDPEFYEREEATLPGFECYAIENYHKVSVMDRLGVKYMKHSGEDGYDYREGYVRHGHNSGYFAIQMAIKMGYTDIRVIGMDGTYKNGSHFYKQDEKMPYGLGHLPYMMVRLKQQMPRDVKITLYGPSVITAFPKKSLKLL